MQFSDLLDEDRKCARDVLDPLSLHRRSRKAREVHRVPGPERVADLAHLLEAANPRSLPGARIYDEDGAFAVIDLVALRRNDAQQRVVDRMGNSSPRITSSLSYIRTELTPCDNISLCWLPRWRRMSMNRTDLCQESRT